MRKLRNEKIIPSLLIIYFIFIFFYGLIIKFTFSNPFLFSIKTYLPETMLGLICIVMLFLKKRIYKDSLFVLISFIAVLIINLFTSFSVASFLMTFRDVYVPLITGYMLCGYDFDGRVKSKLFDYLVILCEVALVVGTIIGLFQYFLGWKWTSSWYTGYSFWGEDKASSMYIMTSGAHVRVPSIAGHNVKFAMYSLFQFLVIFFRKEKKNRITILFFLLLAITNIWISNNKTTLVILLFMIAKYLASKLNQSSRPIYTAVFVLSIAIIAIDLNNSSDFFLSFYDRFSKWEVLKDPAILKNILLPISTFNFAGNSITNVAVLNYWDNTYFYFVFSYGLVTTWLLFIWIRKNIYRCENSFREFVYYLTFFTIFASLTTSIVLGRCFFNIYIIMITFLSDKKCKVVG